MTVKCFYIKGYEAENETIKRVERIWEVTNNVGTFLNIEQEGGLITSVWKKRIDRIEITA